MSNLAYKPHKELIKFSAEKQRTKKHQHLKLTLSSAEVKMLANNLRLQQKTTQFCNNTKKYKMLITIV